MKKKKIILVVFIFISVLSIIISKPLGDLDELWNYNTARAVSEGLVPYKDISLITTPLLPMITSMFLKISTNELLVSRILATFVWTGILYLVFNIFNLILKEENISLIGTAMIGMLCRNIYCIDYNIFILLIAILILYIELRNIKNSKVDLLIRNIGWYSNMY